MMVSTGASILIAQYNGASREDESEHVALASIMLGLALALFLGVMLFFNSDTIVNLFGLEQDVAIFAHQYLQISGTCSGFVTMGVVISTILRAHGFSRSPMVVNLIFGVINVIGNYCVLYSPFGLPVYGVKGVATVTVICQLLGAITLWGILGKKALAPKLSDWLKVKWEIYKKILRIGVMNAGEVLSYNLAQMVIVYFVVQMGTPSLTAFTYAQNIARLSFTFAVALGHASQIQTSYFVGKGWVDSITAKVQRYFLVGLAASVSVSALFYLFHEKILGIFTQDPEVVMIAAGLMLGSIFLEGGRVFNLIFISSLKGAGDVKFPVQAGIASMWGIGVCLTYVLGIHFGLGVIGAWMAIALDEWIRGVIMAYRWRSQIWTKFKLV
jgi:putative MATE family efflux protein